MNTEKLSRNYQESIHTGGGQQGGHQDPRQPVVSTSLPDVKKPYEYLTRREED
jgi:hypothetical protein